MEHRVQTRARKVRVAQRTNEAGDDDSSSGDQKGEWVGVPGAARYLGVTTHTLYRLIDQEGLPAYKLGRVIRLRWFEIDAFLQAHRVVSGSLSHLYTPVK